MAVKSGYEVALIENDLEARLCAKLLAEEFAVNNDLSKFNESTSEHIFNSWLWPLASNILDEKLSFLVRHNSTNEIVATLFAGDLFLRCQREPYDALSPASDTPINDLFDELLDQFVQHDFKQKLEPNMVLFIFAVGTQSKHVGKNLAAQLAIHVCEHARGIKGFQYAFVQTTHPATHHIFVKKLHGKELKIMDPATWLWKKKGDGLSCPVKGYNGEPIVNILINLNEEL